MELTIERWIIFGTTCLVGQQCQLDRVDLQDLVDLKHELNTWKFDAKIFRIQTICHILSKDL